ncbi:MAG: polysaccharide export outer membrane protein [Phycisphaerales bacterium]|jgi:polysaccharide export outer membrane protein
MNRPTPTSAVLGLAILAGTALTGCTDSFMDPSTIGRWEHTPTRVPILTRLAVIEDAERALVEPTSIQPSDLVPEADAYIIGAGDMIEMTIWDLIAVNQQEQYQLQVDQNGYFVIPQLGRIYVAGQTETQVVQTVKRLASKFIDDPLVSAVVQQRRQQQFHLMGGIPNPGPYLIPSADYKLLQALIAGGWSPGVSDEILVIRQVPLTAEAAGGIPERPEDAQPGNPAQPTEPGEDLLDVIDDLSQPSPGVLGGGGRFASQPAQPDPMIDLINSEPPRAPAAAVEPVSGTSPSRWVFREGRWVRVQVAGSVRVPPPDAAPDPLADTIGMVTQRVIRVPTAPLAAGDARYNIIVRPGDMISVPMATTGVIYMGGQIARPGSFNLPQTGKLTLHRAITSAGGLSGLAIPERVDLTRIVGRNEQATVMVNLRAIAEGTQPDIYLKPDDHIIVGTNFWATPLAVIRNGFRASYGFGFLLDRNFGNDVFGAPPSNNSRF